MVCIKPGRTSSLCLSKDTVYTHFNGTLDQRIKLKTFLIQPLFVRPMKQINRDYLISDSAASKREEDSPIFLSSP